MSSSSERFSRRVFGSGRVDFREIPNMDDISATELARYFGEGRVMNRFELA